MLLSCEDMQKVTKILEHYEKEIDLTTTIPLEEYEARYEKVWKRMEEKGIDVGFFYWFREMPGDGAYLTGYNPTLEKASGAIAPGKRPVLLVGPESGLLAEEVGLNLETHFVDTFTIPGEYYEGVTSERLPDVLRAYVGKKIKTIGSMTSRDILPCDIYKVFTQDVAPEAEVVDASDILADLRYEKSENEFACMAVADKIACAAARAMLAVVKPGLRESQVAAVADYVVKSLGGDGYGFETIVNSGDRCKTIIGPASNKVIEAGEIVQIGVSPSYHCYKGVCRRAFVVGKRNEMQEQYFAVLNEGYQTAVDELARVCATGDSSHTVDLKARQFYATKFIDGKKMSDYHYFSSAHGTGLTECLEKQLIHPYRKIYYGNNIGIMLDMGVYHYPHKDICGGCVESAFHKRCTGVVCLTDLPADVQELVGKGL